MPYNSNARDHALSFLPEGLLIKKRQHWALAYKYGVQGNPHPTAMRLDKIAQLRSWRSLQGYPLDVYSNKNYLDGMFVDAQMPSPVTAIDPNRPHWSVVRNETPVTMIHVNHITGPEHAKRQLRLTAQYIDTHEPLRNTELVLGVTYQLLGNIALRHGFDPMHIEDIDGEYLRDLAFSHRASNAIRGIDPADPSAQLQPTAVYLPTATFIERFAGTQ